MAPPSPSPSSFLVLVPLIPGIGLLPSAAPERPIVGFLPNFISKELSVLTKELDVAPLLSVICTPARVKASIHLSLSDSSGADSTSVDIFLPFFVVRRKQYGRSLPLLQRVKVLPYLMRRQGERKGESEIISVFVRAQMLIIIHR